MKTQYLCIFLFIFLGMGMEVKSQILSNDPYDTYENDEEEDEDLEEINTYDDEIAKLGNIIQSDSLGSFGALIKSTVNTYIMTNDEGCSKAYVCMWNLLSKYNEIITYEAKLKVLKLDCKDRQKLLEDYILYIGTINLDIYCVDFLNKLSDTELVNVMFAFQDFYFVYSVPPMLSPYKEARKFAKEYCTGDIYNIEKRKEHKERYEYEYSYGEPSLKWLSEFEEDCDCGEYIGSLDEEQKFKVLTDIRSIIDGINPIWQGQKLIELNEMLQALPCNN